MNCLNKCENAVLDWCLGKGDKYVPQYHCAEHLASDFQVGEVADAFDVLLHVGLLRESGAAVKLSAPAMGDVSRGYFQKMGNTTPELLELQKRLIEVERAHLVAVENAELHTPIGGRAELPPKD